MAPKRGWHDDEILDMRFMFAEGKHVDEIAEKYKTTKVTVYAIVRGDRKPEVGGPMISNLGEVYLAERRKRRSRLAPHVIRLRNKEYTPKQIARNLRCSMYMVRSILRANQ